MMSSVPCKELPGGTKIPMVGLGTWKVGYITNIPVLIIRC